MTAKAVRSNKQIRLVLASGSRFFLEGLGNILREENDINIAAQATNGIEMLDYVGELKPDYVFLDNRILKLNFNNLLKLIDGKSPGSMVILFAPPTGDKKSPKVIHINPETDSIKLREILKRTMDDSSNGQISAPEKTVGKRA